MNQVGHGQHYNKKVNSQNENVNILIHKEGQENVTLNGWADI